MRLAAVLGVIAAAGCNQIFGLGPTDPLPDGAQPDAALPKVRLTWQIANTLPGGPDPMLEYAPIVPAPLVRVGRIDGPLTETVYLADGAVQIPIDFPGTLWRLEYTIDGVAHEVHWSPALDMGHVIVPLAGRLMRDPVPAGGGYRIMASGAPATHPDARVYTTGVWTGGAVASLAPTVDYPFSSANSLSGPIGAPAESRGDDGVLVDLTTNVNCAYAVGSASFVTPTMTGTLSPTTPVYSGAVMSATVSYSTASLEGRLGSALGGRKGPNMPEGRTLLGYAASASLPGFTEKMLGLTLGPDPALLGPALLAVADCKSQPTAIPIDALGNTVAAARPTALTAFPLVVHTEFWDQRRMVDSDPFLVSGIAASMTSTTETYNLDMRIPFAIAPLKLGPVDLAAADDVAVPVATGRVELTYELEVGSTPHYHELVLYEVVSGASPRLERRRVYTSATRAIQVDTSVLTAGTRYVFSIHTVRGRPNASTGDYTKIEYPQAATTIFTRTFIAR